MKPFAHICTAYIVFCGACLAADKSGETKSRPNVLILLTDDQRADTIAALGNPDILTPNLDEIVRRGCSMSNTYCLGANMGAVCRPSRNMVMSGRTYFRWANPADGSKPARNAPAIENTLPAAFNAAGYETYHHGKQGNTAELIHRQFNHTHYLQDFDDRWSMEAGKKVADDAIDFLQDRSDESPWLMYLAFAMPHDPRAASVESLRKYDADSLQLPVNRLAAHPFDNGAVVGRDEWTAIWPRTDQRLRWHYHDYYACITTIDHHIGRLFKHLKNTDQFENTIIVFTSDHGLAMGSHGLMGKQNVYEAGYKPPMLIAGPGVRRGKSDHLNYLLDLHPTLCDLAGIKVPEGLDGRSFAGTLRKANMEPARNSIMLSYTNTQRAVRDGNWKLIRYPQVNRTQLFDLASDPTEMNDLSKDSSQSNRIEQLLTKLGELQSEAGDTQPLDIANPTDGRFDAPETLLADEVAPPENVPGLQCTSMVGGVGSKPGKPFTVLCGPDEVITAIAIGTDREDASVVTAIRFDLLNKKLGDQSRRAIIAGDTESRFAPLADQMNESRQPIGLFGRADAVIHSLGIIQSNHRRKTQESSIDDRRVPAFGGVGGEYSFEIQISNNDSRRRSDRFRGFHGTTTTRNGQTVIESLGILYVD